MTWTDLLSGLLWLGAGIALGTAYFLLLQRSVRQTLSGAAMTQVLPLYVLRIAGAAGAFWAIAQYGALALVLALAGFLIGKFLVQWRVGAA
jgi:hypothetical protein